MRPPPIQEPWKIDERGRLVSTPWILWLQEVSGGTVTAAATTADGTTTSTTNQTVVINNVTYDTGALLSELGLLVEFSDVDTSSSFIPAYLTDADVFLDSATTHSTGVNDAELFCWMSL